MIKKAIIYDLDNTIYSVKSIGEELLAPLFDLIVSTTEHNKEMSQIRKELMGIPFQKVAAKHGFSKELIQKSNQLLRDLTYKGGIQPFEDYEKIKEIPGDRYLVTMGFTKMQWSKIRCMGIEEDFQEIHVVDPDISSQTKKDVFAAIIKRKGYAISEVLVVGDDPASEIKAARELGIDTAIMDKSNQYGQEAATYRIADFMGLKKKLERLGK